MISQTALITLLSIFLTICSISYGNMEKVGAVILQLENSCGPVNGDLTGDQPEAHSKYLRQKVRKIDEMLQSKDFSKALNSIKFLKSLMEKDQQQNFLVDLEELVHSIHKDHQDELSAPVKNLIEKCSSLLVEAKYAEQLDGILKETVDLSLKFKHEKHVTVDKTSLMKIEVLQDLITKWQDYLFSLSIGDELMAKNSLDSISGLLGNYPFVPRSYVLRLKHDFKNQLALSKKPAQKGLALVQY